MKALLLLLFMYLHDVVFGDVHKLGSVLQHGENGSLDVDHPGGIFVVGAHRFHGTILPGEEERSFLQFAGINLTSHVEIM